MSAVYKQDNYMGPNISSLSQLCFNFSFLLFNVQKHTQSCPWDCIREVLNPRPTVAMTKFCLSF